MGKIFCLMGKSASGKDTVYRKLMERSDLGLKPVIPYTTRPIRSGEKDGETYFFRTQKEAADMQAAGQVIEMRTYQTVHGPWSYFTADDGQIDLTRGSYLLIGTLEAYEKIRDHFGPEAVVPLYLWTDDGLRLLRALERERAQKEPKYAELCRRFLADEADFSEERLEEAGIEKRFENQGLEELTAELADWIREQMRPED